MNIKRIVQSSGRISLIAVWAIAAISNGEARESPEWSGKMRELYKVLGELVVDVSSDSRFEASENQTRLKSNAKKLSELAHSLGKKGMQSPDQDPSVAMFASIFADEAKRAHQTLLWGYRPYARELLRSIPSHCISCHTRTQQGPSFDALPTPKEVTSFTATARGDFFAATRQYKRALDEFVSVIDDASLASTSPFEWANAVRQSLAIAVRVNEDPLQTQQIIEKV